MEVRDIIPSPTTKPAMSLSKAPTSDFRDILGHSASKKSEFHKSKGFYAAKSKQTRSSGADKTPAKGNPSKKNENNIQPSKEMKNTKESSVEDGNSVSRPKNSQKNLEESKESKSDEVASVVEEAKATVEEVQSTESSVSETVTLNAEAYDILDVETAETVAVIPEEALDSSYLTGDVKLKSTPKIEGTDFAMGNEREQVKSDDVLNILAEMDVQGGEEADGEKSFVAELSEVDQGEQSTQSQPALQSEQIQQNQLQENPDLASNEKVVTEGETEISHLTEAVGVEQKNQEEAPKNKEVQELPEDTEAESKALKDTAKTASKTELKKDDLKGDSKKKESKNTNKENNLMNVGHQKSEAVRHHENMRAGAPRAIAKQVVDKITANIKVLKGGKALEVQLTPEHLGKVMMKLEMSKGTMSASIKVENSEVKNALEASIVELKQALEEKGVSVKEINVSVSEDGHRGGEEYSGNKNGQRDTEEEGKKFDLEMGRMIDESEGVE